MTKTTTKKAKRQPQAKPVRTLRWFPNQDDEYSPIAGIVEMTIDGKVTEYVVAEFPTGWLGRGFCLEKVGGDGATYSVFCSQSGECADSCDCADATFRPFECADCNGLPMNCSCREPALRGRVCKHRAAIRKLIEVGKL